MKEPIEMKAGDERVLVNGLPLPVDYRIVWEENYKQLKQAFDLGAVMPRFSKQDVIDCLKQRDKEAFDNPHQKYEHREINQAIDIIIRLMPPSSFPNGE